MNETTRKTKIAFEDALPPGGLFVPLRRPCDDPHLNFEKIRTLEPGFSGNKPAPDRSLIQGPVVRRKIANGS